MLLHAWQVQAMQNPVRSADIWATKTDFHHIPNQTPYLRVECCKTMSKAMTTEKKSFQELVSESPVPVLVDVYSENCGPCHAMKPVLQELKQSLGDGLRIIKINGYTNAKFMQEYQIRAFPTLLLFHQGKVVWTREGFMTASMLGKMIKAHTVGNS